MIFALCFMRSEIASPKWNFTENPIIIYRRREHSCSSWSGRQGSWLTPIRPSPEATFAHLVISEALPWDPYYPETTVRKPLVLTILWSEEKFRDLELTFSPKRPSWVISSGWIFLHSFHPFLFSGVGCALIATQILEVVTNGSAWSRLKSPRS